MFCPPRRSNFSGPAKRGVSRCREGQDDPRKHTKLLELRGSLIDQAITSRITAGDGYTINSMIESIIRGEDFLDNRVKSIKQPTLVVWGREDGLTPLADGERFKKEIRNSSLLVIDQCGHVPQFEKAAEFNAAVLKFLQAN
jgi:pimeloyl-ACP methyl ester carboxylesterase